MQNRPERASAQGTSSPSLSRSATSNANVTSAVGMEMTSGHLRARRNALFTRTVMWITGLICVAFLLGTFAQAWSNSQLAQQVQTAQQHLQDLRAKHAQLQKLADKYKDPQVIEKEAREQLGYSRPGEQVVQVVSPHTRPQMQASARPAVAPAANYWQDWWRTFFQ